MAGSGFLFGLVYLGGQTIAFDLPVATGKGPKT
jgi:hypothetical protein